MTTSTPPVGLDHPTIVPANADREDAESENPRDP